MKQMILIGITGGIAAVKTPELVTNLSKRNFDVRVIMTPSATRIVDANELKSASEHRVYTQLFDDSFKATEILANRHVEHIDLANRASLFVVVPATANVIAKIAAGIADDYVTTTALAATCPILVCPSMNVFMWNNPATQRNIETLHTLGIHTFGPDKGMLACGYEGEGRLPTLASIEEEVFRFIKTTSDLKGKRVIITAGGTIEPIDDVRVITNRSSGKMGIAIADECFLRGADVLLLRSDSAAHSRYGIKEQSFTTAESLRQLIKTNLSHCDIFIHAAAVSDFKVKNSQAGKSSSETPLSLELEPQTKILDAVKTINPNVFLVAFKAEYRLSDKTLIGVASKRLHRAHADMIVANDVGKANQGIGSDYNEVHVIHSDGQNKHIPRAPKTIIAGVIVTEMIKHLK